MQKLRLSMSKKNLTKRFEKTVLADRFKSDKQNELNKEVDKDSVIKRFLRKITVSMIFSIMLYRSQRQTAKEILKGFSC